MSDHHRNIRFHDPFHWHKPVTLAWAAYLLSWHGVQNFVIRA